MAGPPPLRWLSRANELLARATAVVAGILLVAMTVVVGASVYFRYVQNESLVWGPEATRYLAIWLVFLGVGLAHRWGQHVRIGILLERLPGRSRHFGALVVELVVLAIFAVIAWFGWEIAMSNFERTQVSPAMGVRIGWMYLSVPVGLGLAALQSLERASWSGYALVTGSDVPPIGFGQSPEEVTTSTEAGA